ncbi:MAG: hypothetical protein P9L94_12625 [Candidatus Hinthialibacter antarcticus]|nr:hypothetical protein [Candidatus Hinthialibacter antarcticus]
MKKWIQRSAVLLCAPVFVCAAFAQDTSVNVNEFQIPELATVPVIDGDLSDAAWDNVPVIPMDQNGDNDAAEAGTGDLDITLKVAWDDETNALYFHINVIDDALVSTRGRGSSAGDGGWANERLEIILDGLNTGDAASANTTPFHHQYVFDMPNTWDPWASDNDIENGVFFDQEIGLFNTADGGIPVSSSFVSIPIFERIEGALDVTNAHAPWNVNDSYLESAAMIRVTDPGASEWIEAPVEYNYEIKVVVFDELWPAADLDYEIDNPDNVAAGWESFFADEFHIVKDLEVNSVVGFSSQMNDADIWSDAPTREHQTNTTGVAGNWNSSESLSALVLVGGSSVPDWALQ